LKFFGFHDLLLLVRWIHAIVTRQSQLMVFVCLLIVVAVCEIKAVSLNEIATASPPRREAVVLMIKSVDQKCTIDRVLALAVSSRGMKAYRDVWVLVDRDLVIENETMKKLTEAGVHVDTQPNISKPMRLSRFHGQASGVTKPSFLEWVTSKPEYDFAWHIEDDSFYTGRWGDLFDVCVDSAGGMYDPSVEGQVTSFLTAKYKDSSNQSKSKEEESKEEYHNSFLLRAYAEMLNQPFNNSADVVANWVLNHNSHWYNWHSCYIFGKSCMHAGQQSLQFMWPVARFSKRFIIELKAALEAGGGANATRGHHEALTANFCLYSSSWCSMSALPRVGNVKAFASGVKYNNASKMSLAYVAGKAPPYKIQASRLYHPVKCAAGEQAGSEALKYALSPRPATP
ncbi:unnamed protein product, partial [Prorocentrum cordatum]